MEFAAQEDMIRQQYADRRKQSQASAKSALDRYMRARSECAAGNASSCQMVPGLQEQLKQMEREAPRLNQEEQRMIAELRRQKEMKLNEYNPTVLFDTGSLQTSIPGSQEEPPESGSSIGLYTNQGRVI